MILHIFVWFSRSTTPKFSIEILKADSNKTFKAVFFKKCFRLLTGTQSRIIVWAIDHINIYQLSQDLHVFL